MNTIQNVERMEKLRKSRSLNDVVTVVKNIAKDIGRSKNFIARWAATAAAEPQVRRVSTSAGASKAPKSIRIGHLGDGPDIEVKSDPARKDNEAKQVNRAKFANKRLSSGLKVSKYVAPDVSTAEKIQNKIDVVHDLHENLVELDAAREKIKHQFRGAKNLKVALNGIQALQDELQVTLAKAYDLLENIAKKHIPAELEMMAQSVQEFINENIPSTKYESMREEVYVTVKAPTDANEGNVSKGPKKIKIDINKADFAFHCYTIIDNLKNSEGYEFEEYCIVLTGLVDRTGVMHYFLNALPDFKTPGKFNIGQEIQNDQEMEHRMSMLLAHNDVVTELERKPMPLTTKTAKEKGFHSIEGAEEIHVVDDTLRVTVTKDIVVGKNKHGESKLSVMKAEVSSLLRSILGKRNKAKILPRVAHDEKGRTVLIFSLIPDIPDNDEKKDYKLNVEKLNDLKHVLGLPDDVIEDVKKAMLHRT